MGSLNARPHILRLVSVLPMVIMTKTRTEFASRVLHHAPQGLMKIVYRLDDGLCTLRTVLVWERFVIDGGRVALAMRRS